MQKKVWEMRDQCEIIHSLNKYLLTINCMPSTILHARDTHKKDKVLALVEFMFSHGTQTVHT